MPTIEWKDRTLVEKVCIVLAGILLMAALVVIVYWIFMLEKFSPWGFFFMTWANFLMQIANRRAQPASFWSVAWLVLWGLLAVGYTVGVILLYL